MSGEVIFCAPDDGSGLNYTRPLLDMEKNFDMCRTFTWLARNWTLNYYFISLYIVVIFAGRSYMKSRPPFQLKGALLFWNTFLAAYSIFGTWRLLTATLYSVQEYGLFATSCTMGGGIDQRRAVGLWLALFFVSKIVEFGDTVFIVLRKSPLIFLHWYHHVTVAFFVWSTAVYGSPMHIYFCMLNMFVHSIMYSYFALKTLGVRIPKVISVSITLLQIVQMVIGIRIILYMRQVKATDPSCQLPHQAVTIGASIYFSYFLLFLDFFRKSYMMGRKRVSGSTGEFKKLS